MVAEEPPMAVNGRIASCNGGKIPVFFIICFYFNSLSAKRLKNKITRYFVLWYFIAFY